MFWAPGCITVNWFAELRRVVGESENRFTLSAEALRSGQMCARRATASPRT